MPLPAFIGMGAKFMGSPMGRQLMSGMMGGSGAFGRRRRRRRTLSAGERSDIAFLKSQIGPGAVASYLASRR